MPTPLTELDLTSPWLVTVWLRLRRTSTGSFKSPRTLAEQPKQCMTLLVEHIQPLRPYQAVPMVQLDLTLCLSQRQEWRTQHWLCLHFLIMWNRSTPTPSPTLQPFSWIRRRKGWRLLWWPTHGLSSRSFPYPWDLLLGHLQLVKRSLLSQPQL